MAYEEKFMKKALALAKKAYEQDEVPVGAVIVKDGKIIEEDTVENIEKNNITYLTIESDDISKIKKDLNLKIISEHNNLIKFMNNLSPNEIMEKISKYKINKLLIEELTIEDLFMEYYKQEVIMLKRELKINLKRRRIVNNNAYIK